MSLACATGCTQRDRHLSDCPCADPQHQHGEYLTSEETGWADCPNCTGCLPRLAADRLAVCPNCERTARDGLTELPDLWVDLAERPRLAGVSKAPASEGDTPDPMSDARRQERSAIKAMLVAWCLTLEDDYTINLPDEQRIAATTRNIAAWHSAQARHARDAANLLDMPTTGPLHRDAEGAIVLRRQAAELAEHARAVRDDRETGRDILRAICEHITRHLDRLLTGEHAEQLVADIKAAMKARSMAYPTRPGAVRITCVCGSTINVTITGATCGGCGVTIAPPVDTEGDGSPSTAVDLAGWLLVAHGIDLGSGSHARIRQWAVRYPEEVIRAGRNDKGHVVYERPGVLAVAKRLAVRKGAAA